MLLALVVMMALGGTACRTTAARHVSDPGPAIARLQDGGSIQAEVDQLVRPLVNRGEVYGMVVGVVTEISWLRVGWERKALICRPTIQKVSTTFLASSLVLL
jgi:hypothetical protein